MLVRKAYEKSPHLPDGQRKVIRNMLALAEKERVLRSSMVHPVAQFFAEYTKSYRDDSIEEWDRFGKSDQCRAMGQPGFTNTAGLLLPRPDGTAAAHRLPNGSFESVSTGIVQRPHAVPKKNSAPVRRKYR
jgi:hypothetical protein